MSLENEFRLGKSIFFTPCCEVKPRHEDVLPLQWASGFHPGDEKEREEKQNKGQESVLLPLVDSMDRKHGCSHHH